MPRKHGYAAYHSAIRKKTKVFLTPAAGALVYVTNEMFKVGGRLIGPVALGWV